MTERTGDNGPANTEVPRADAADGPGVDANTAADAAAADAGASAEAGAGGAEVQALRERYLRLAAEYENYRKRTEKERVESWGRAQAQLVQQLLDPLDDLQRVADFHAETTSLQALLEGVQMVERKILRTLQTAGLEVLDASGQPFDPTVHEAIMTASADSHEDDDTVGEVFQKGYRFKGDLLRPARVQVRKHGA